MFGDEDGEVIDVNSDVLQCFGRSASDCVNPLVWRYHGKKTAQAAGKDPDYYYTSSQQYDPKKVLILNLNVNSI